MVSTAVFLAAQQGPRVLQKHSLGEWPPDTTLRELGASILPTVVLLRVEAAATMGGDPADFSGDMLDKSVGFVVLQARLQFLKCCFAVDNTPPPPATGTSQKKRPSAFDAMMGDKKRATQYHWPLPYALSENKRAIRSIANDIMSAGKSDVTAFGGFSSTAVAAATRAQFWNLAVVLYSVVRRAAAMANRSMPIPATYVYIYYIHIIKNS